MSGQNVWSAVVGASVLALVAWGCGDDAGPRADPVIEALDPGEGVVGTSVAILGQGLGDATAVFFDETAAASFTVASDRTIVAVVGAGSTSGPVKVVTPRGDALSATPFTVFEAPTVGDLTPTAGAIGSTVHIAGAHLASVTGVRIGEVAAASFAVVSDSEITAVIAPGSISEHVTVTTKGGSATTLGVFTVLPTPLIESLRPASGHVGDSIDIYGDHLRDTSAVRFGEVAATSFTVVDNGIVRAIVPAGAVDATVSLTTPGGVATSSETFDVVAFVPAITGLAPASGAVGTQVTISGSHLSGASAVAFAGTAASDFEVVDDGSIRATVPLDAATGAVTVTTEGGVATSPSAFTITAPAAPTLTGFTPASGAVGTTVTISGTDLLTTRAVAFHGVAAASFEVVDATSVSAVVAAGTTSGPVSLTTDGGSAASEADFIVLAPPAIVGLAPVAGGIGATVTIDGSDLGEATAVSFNGTAAASFEVVSDTRVTAVVAGGTTTGPVAVTTPRGTATSSDDFTVLPAPAVTGFTPASGKSGTLVTIDGAHFDGVIAVAFGGTSAASFEIVSSTQLTAFVASGSHSGKVSVVTAGGIGRSESDFTFYPQPTIAILSPSTGVAGVEVTINGTGLTGASAVAFGGVAAASFVVDSDATVRAVAAIGSRTGRVTITTPGGVGTSPADFIYLASPQVSGFAPASAAAGDVITVVGEDLATTNAVTIGGIAASDVHVISGSRVTARVAVATVDGPVALQLTNGPAVASQADFHLLTAPVVAAPFMLGATEGCAKVLVFAQQYDDASIETWLEYSTDGTTFTRAHAALGDDGATYWDTPRDVPGRATVSLRAVARIAGRASNAGTTTAGTPRPDVVIPNGPRVNAAVAASDELPGERGDLDHDGFDDLVTWSVGSAAIGVAPGRANGTFGAAAALAASAPLSFATLADYDRDGHLDIVLVEPSLDGIEVMAGRGDLGFDAPTQVADADGAMAVAVVDGALVTIDGANAIAAGDIDGDGVIDLATDSGLWRGRGDGDYDPVQTIAAAGPHLRLVDLDRDGRLDLVSTSASQHRDLLMNSSARRCGHDFVASRVEPVATAPRAVASGVLVAADRLPTIVTADAAAMAIGDVTGDEVPDQVLADADGLWLLRGHVIIASFDPPEALPGAPDGAFDGVAIGDVDADGVNDVVAVEAESGDVVIVGAVGSDVLAGTGPTLGVALADLDGDGALDVLTVAATAPPAVLTVYAGRADGSFEPPETQELAGDPVAFALAPRAQTFDLVLVGATGRIATHTNDGSGAFGGIASATRQLDSAAAPSDIAIADLASDSSPDLIVARADADQLAVVDDLAAPVLPQVSHLATAPKAVVAADLDHDGDDEIVRSDDGAAALGDLDADGQLDLVVAVAATPTLSVRFGDGQGAFPSRVDSAADAGLIAVAVGDVDRDGHRDVVTLSSAEAKLAVRDGLGDGHFEARRTYPVGAGASALALADLDGDGNLDVLVAERGAARVVVVHGVGDGTFTTTGVVATFASGADPSALAAADLDRDGNLDVLVATAADETLTRLRLTVDGYVVGGRWLAGPSPSGLALTDADRDGRRDVLVLGGDSAYRILLTR